MNTVDERDIFVMKNKQTDAIEKSPHLIRIHQSKALL